MVRFDDFFAEGLLTLVLGILVVTVLGKFFPIKPVARVVLVSCFLIFYFFIRALNPVRDPIRSVSFEEGFTSGRKMGAELNYDMRDGVPNAGSWTDQLKMQPAQQYRTNPGLSTQAANEVNEYEMTKHEQIEDSYQFNPEPKLQMVYQGRSIPLPREERPAVLPTDQFIFADVKVSPNCCPATFSTADGCVCLSKDQMGFLNRRGENHNMSSEI